MIIHSIYDAEFIPYGKIITGYDNESIVEVLNKTPLPEAVAYVPSEPTLESLPVFEQLKTNFAGDMPIQMGYCNGHNTKLNCLEYHRDSEVNLGATDFVLLLAKQDEVVDGKIDSSKVKAFRAPAGVMIEVYATSLHFAPCSAKKGDGFKVLILLAKGTNTEKPATSPIDKEDKLLFARNKWLIAHPESKQASMGAHVGITGENINVENLI